MRLPGQLSHQEFDAALAAGERRTGVFLYRTACAACQACQPLRLEPDVFRPSATQRRILRRGRRELRLELGPPQSDAQRLDLFNRHRQQRQLGHDELDRLDYDEFLVETCCDTLELAFYRDERLVAVAICDRGEAALSAVYSYFDPEFARYSPGTLAILTELELCRAWRYRYLYLGFYVAANPHLSYKAQFGPHQRLIDGTWTLCARRR